MDETPCQTQPRPADSPGLHQSSPKMAVRQPPEPVERTWLHQEGAERIFLVFLRFTVRQQTNQAPVLENLAERLSRRPRSRADHSIELQKNPRQMTDEGFGCLKNRRYLLSRFWHYHRLKVLNFCVRDGNRCDHFDMFTGRELAGLYALPILNCSTFWCDQYSANTFKLRHGPI